MHHFSYRGGVLHAEDVPLPRIAAEVGTPFYCYSTATLTRHFTVFADVLGGYFKLLDVAGLGREGTLGDHLDAFGGGIAVTFGIGCALSRWRGRRVAEASITRGLYP